MRGMLVAGPVALLIGAGFLACASDEPVDVQPDAGPSSVQIDASDAFSDGGAADASDADACADCEFFPNECAADRFCAVEAQMDPTTRLRALSGSSRSDVWAVGTQGTVLHFDGSSWKRTTIANGETLSAVVGLSRDEVWAAGMVDKIYVRSTDGGGPDPGASGWSLVTPAEAPDTMYFGYGAVRGASHPVAGATWFAAEVPEGQGSVLARVKRTPDGIETATLAYAAESRFLAAHAVSESEVWAVGAVGNAARITGADTNAPTVAAFNTQTFATLRGVWGATSNDVWAVGSEGTVRRYSGEGRLWSVVSDAPTQATLRAITGTSASDVWAVGDDGVVIHFDGKQWSRIAVAGMGARRPALHAVWASSADDVWIAGDGVLLSLGGKGGAP